MAIDYGPDGEISGIEILSAQEHLGISGDEPEIMLESLKAKAA